jgi:peptide/nickel transport system substrate-binding protein
MITRRSLFVSTAAAALMPMASIPVQAEKASDTLNAAFQLQLPSLNRYYAPGREGYLLGLLAYDALVYRDPNTLEFKPLLATSWKQLDPLTWEFKLRPGVKFHNGDAFTAEDVAYTFGFASNPANNVFNQMVGSWIAKTEIVDPMTVRIHARAVTPLVLEYIIQMPIVPGKYYEAVGRTGFAAKPVGTGPYTVAPGSANSVIFTRFEDYYEGGGKNKPYIKTLVYHTIPEVSTQVAELISGGLDWAYYIPDDAAQKLKTLPQLKVVNADTFRIGFITMDAAGQVDPNSPLKDVRVRQAIAHAVDKSGISSKLVGGSSHVIDAACTPSQFGCTTEVAKYNFDPDAARKLMAAAGYDKGFVIDVYAYRSRPVAEAIIGNLAAIGIHGNLRWMQYPAVIAARRSHQAAIVIDDYGSAGVNDVGGILPFFYDNAPDDQSHDPIVSQGIEAGGSTADQDKRLGIYKTVLQRVAEQAYWVPLFTMPVNYVCRKELDIPVPRDENVEFWRARWV